MRWAGQYGDRHTLTLSSFQLPLYPLCGSNGLCEMTETQLGEKRKGATSRRHADLLLTGHKSHKIFSNKTKNDSSGMNVVGRNSHTNQDQTLLLLHVNRVQVVAGSSPISTRLSLLIHEQVFCPLLLCSVIVLGCDLDKIGKCILCCFRLRTTGDCTVLS